MSKSAPTSTNGATNGVYTKGATTGVTNGVYASGLYTNGAAPPSRGQRTTGAETLDNRALATKAKVPTPPSDAEGTTPKFQCPSLTIHEEPFSQGMLSIVVLGASGDLAKKKTYPSLMDLYLNGFLPPWVSIVGYARSAAQPEEFREKLRPWLLKAESDEAKVEHFLSRCTYFKGAYDSAEDFANLNQTLLALESQDPGFPGPNKLECANRLFYFAIPPDAFLTSATSIKASAMTSNGFNRLIVEKPFGHDFVSAQQLIDDLGSLFTEDYIYRIDHYLAKELVQNLYMFRFGNSFLEPTFNHHYISSVQITFKEPFGTEGRGGYFTNYGIIRDVIQNHLMQVLSIVAMEPPPRVQGEDAGTFIRDAKNNVLRCIAAIDPEDVVIGQYVGADGKPGYLEDDSIKDKEKAKYVPTYAAVVLRINNPRWHGVPFVLKAGKALNERKVDVRIQYKDPPASEQVFGGQRCARNELVMRLQPDEAVYMKINVKEPGLATKPIQSEMDLSYKARYRDVYNPEAYTRLILEALRGNQANFVRSDELLNSWKIFDPLLTTLEQTEKRMPLPYAYGSRGPAAADQLMEKAGGFRYETGYVWKSPTLR
jgi:glucose-6-phosphate 1-dehydrogenase